MGRTRILALAIALALHAPQPWAVAAPHPAVHRAIVSRKMSWAERLRLKRIAAWRARRLWLARLAWRRRLARRWRYRKRVARSPQAGFVPGAFQGDIYVACLHAPLLMRPWRSATVLALMPKATVLTSLGCHGGYYRAEAPDGKVGYVSARCITGQPPAW